MSFSSDEKSVQDSQPIELFTFTRATGALVRYTSYSRDVVYLGNTYVAKQVRRSAVQVVGAGDVPGVTVEVFVDDPVVQGYIGQGVPPQSMTITITRLQVLSGAVEQQWTGYVNQCSVRKRTAAFLLSAVTDGNFATQIPKVVVSRQCNHTLYDQFCTVPRSAYATTIASLVGRVMTVVTGFSLANQWLRWGEVQHPGTKERRSIVDHVNNGIGGAVITIDVAWPSTVNLTDEVDLFPGCDRNINTCRDKFANVVNFGGHPHIQSANFFFLDIRRAAGS